MHWNKNGYAVTVRINLFAVGDGGGDLCTADPGSSHADIACVVVDTLAGVICRSTVTACITGNAGVDNHRGGRGIVDCPAGDCGAMAWAEMAAYVRPSAVAARHSPMWLLPPAPCCSLLTEGCYMTISRISLRQWTDLASVWASPLQ